MANFSFEIVEHLGTLSTSANGWTKELNRVSYNGAEPKFDIRAWNEDHSRMTKGVTLSTEEFEALRDLLK
ncbi:MAG: YdbC family protein [Peptoniphilus sp.]|nr:YdbC family protein [Peptoniphilus sp.]MDD7363637.1 YdbC family protein [Bacillota bacterium]MDY6044717.1 YdbC family protein [Peptoniphilus sp.]